MASRRPDTSTTSRYADVALSALMLMSVSRRLCAIGYLPFPLTAQAVTQWPVWRCRLLSRQCLINDRNCKLNRDGCCGKCRDKSGQAHPRGVLEHHHARMRVDDLEEVFAWRCRLASTADSPGT